MTLRTYRYFQCPNGHKGQERTSENDQPYSKMWETISLTGMRESGDGATYTCSECGRQMALIDGR